MKRDKQTTEQASNRGRRRFMRTLAIGGGAATLVAATASFAGSESDPGPAGESAPPAEGGSKGYHVTPHIEEYYRKAAL